MSTHGPVQTFSLFTPEAPDWHSYLLDVVHLGSPPPPTSPSLPPRRIQTGSLKIPYTSSNLFTLYPIHPGADPGGPRGPRPPLDPRFWGPKIEHFWALFNFSIIFFASLCLAYYFFNMLLFQSSNSKIFQPCFTRHMICHLEVFVFSLSFTH